MDDERLSRVKDILADALERAPAERDAYVRAACADDDALRDEVLSLLEGDVAADTWLVTPVVGEIPDAFDAPARALVGTRVGRYRLERLVAVGGMGAVYEAAQDEPCRTVALKLIRPGFASRSVLRRFELEAQVLGRLQHPGIAQIYEAGQLEIGGVRQPFFAMEFVDGRSLLEFASQEDLRTADRVELMIAVCDAVQHAHAKGVVHRDLKPGNILVDASGQPKVLDFGVAKLTDADVQATTLRTSFGQVIGTIPYMSPEQLVGDPEDVDTRCDVYALGVITYELLTGRLPYDFVGVPLPSAIRRIQEEAPRRLSTFSRDLAGDLETITFKALAKERERRYASASELAMDLRRYLSDEPIEARPTSVVYQMRLFARRHRAVVGAIAAMVMVLVAATVVSTLFAVSAERQRRTAAAAQRDAEFRAYTAELAAAAGALRTHDVDEARRRLHATPPSRRGWEWWHLANRVDQSLRTLEGHTAPVLDVAFSPDGAIVATASGASYDDDSSVRLWEAGTGRAVASRRVESDSVTSIAFSPDGALVAAGAQDGRVRVWSSDLEGEPTVLLGHTAHVTGLAYTSDALHLVSASADGTVRSWERNAGRAVGTRITTAAPIDKMALSPSGRWTALAVRNQSVEVWNLETRERILTLDGHEEEVTCVAFDPEGRYLVSGSRDTTARLWDLETGETLSVLRGHTGDVHDVAFAAGGERVVTVSADRTLRLWTAATGRPLAVRRGHGDRLVGVDVSPDGALLATASADETARLWDATVLDELPTMRGHTGLIRQVAFSPDGTRLVSASFDRTARVWDTARGEEVYRLAGHDDVVGCATFSPDGRLIATGANDLRVRLWDADTGALLRTLSGHEYGVSAVAFSPDGSELASGGVDRTVRIWDVATGALRDTLPGHEGWIWSLRYAPGGALVSAGVDGILIWDPVERQLVRRLAREGHIVTSIAISRDGAHLASAAMDGNVIVWSLVTGRIETMLTGHNDEVWDVAFSPDGSRVVSASFDDNIRFWDLTSDAESEPLVLTLPALTHNLRCLAWSPDGTTIATAGGSYEGTETEIRLLRARPAP